MAYENKLKLTLAEQEAKETGGDVKEIYLRMGGLYTEDPVVEAPKKSVMSRIKKAVKKAKKK